MLSKFNAENHYMKLFIALSICFTIFSFGGCEESDLSPDTDIVEPVTFTDIVNDVEVHGTNSEYKGQKVTITAAGKIVEGAHVPTIELFTHNSKVRFFTTDGDYNLGEFGYLAYMRSDLAHIRSHTTYTFTLFIKSISEYVTTDGGRFFGIYADVPEHTEKTDIEVLDVTLDQIVADVSTDSKNYLGKTVRLQGTVSLDQIIELLGYSEGIDAQLAMLKSGQMPLATNKNNVVFWVVDDMGPFSAVNLSKYDNHQTYTFTLYIESVWARKGHYSIFSGVADD